MYIITDKDNVIFNISATKDYQENGNLLVNDGQLAIPQDLINEIYEIENVPEEVQISKYCYTETEGFYKNPNYREIVTPEIEIQQLKEQVTDLQLALAEIYESEV